MSTELTVHAYFPESEHLKDKHQPCARLCTESCAVIEPANHFRILAARGEGLHPNTDFRVAVGMSPAEKAALNRALEGETHLLLTADQKPLLIFADWLPSLGLLFAILPACEHSAAENALYAMGRTDFVSTPVSPPKHTAEACRAAYRMLFDIFSYTDVILQNHAAHPSTHRLVLRIAAFAGCHPDGETVYTFSHLPIPFRSQKATAFLLCTFLFLRDREGALNPTDGHSADIRYRVTLQRNEPTPKAELSALPVFATAACFEDCDVRREGNDAVLIFLDPTDAKRLSDGRTEPTFPFCLRIEQIRIPA